ncbi:DNA-binding response regulator [Allokutzneria sp. A3M-2-11 16]|uniref:DNA-binding response regulator n=1 Tax=Allokutzneria sp. A3M-2-11 16 TaxID=2962043 RepID=UPI0020B750F7|nr:DNA-binding response regulator [Allokutzneria sp. A3M-2-11 16]MCP3802854.1 DNA-binding response regulator [Allokutzneria sp. A3M-2-11 16]
MTSTIVRSEEALFARTAHLFASATEVACAADDLNTWASSRPRPRPQLHGDKRVRKMYRPGVLLDPTSAAHLRELDRVGVDVRISPDEINETIILDRRLVILAGELVGGSREFSVFDSPDVVRSVSTLFEAAWRVASPLAAYEVRFAELRALAPKLLDVLASGCKDETAARRLDLGVRTYRRRVAELMAALGATSRFQAGVRARELGLV